MKKVLVLALLVLAGCQATNTTDQVCFESKCFDVRVADEPQERTQGLMFLEEMPEDEGMIFVFNQSDVYSFWMKNTYINLDMIWMEKDGSVVYVERNATPCKEEPCKSYNPGVKAKYVLEVNAGQAENVSVGDKAEINI